MALTKVLVVVKTYPTLSRKHIETVCTAGFREDGSWIRIFPIPFRMLEEYERFAKWQWIEVNLKHDPSHDDRPESYHIIGRESLRILDRIDRIPKKPDWDLRRQWMEKGKRIFTNMSELIDLAKRNTLSLAILKPSEVMDFVCEKREDHGDEKRKFVEGKLKAEKMQTDLFEENAVKENFKLAEQIPYKFSYKFKTDDGQDRKIMVEDWEVNMLYRNCLRSCSGNEEEACRKVRAKYMSMTHKDIYLIMGTTFEWHRKKAPNPFVIIGVLAPPFKGETQLSLDFS